MSRRPEHTTAAYDAGDFTLPAAAFVGAITDAAIDDDADGDADHLRVTAPLAARVAGTYTLRALLEDSSGTFIAAAEASAPLDVAPTDVTVSFPGEESAGRTRTARTTSSSRSSTLRATTSPGATTTPPHTRTRTSRSRAPASGVCRPRRGCHRRRPVRDPQRRCRGLVHEAGTYVVEGSLLDAAGTFIAAASSVPQFLDPGEHTVSLPFEGGSIRDSATDGPYLVSGLELKLAADSVDAIAGTRSTAAYLRTAFQGAGAATTGTVTDRTEDTDADGLHDTLAVDIELSVGASDFYSYNARLVDGAGNEIVWSSGSEFLDSGLRTITLRFDGRWIQGNGADGPFRIENLSVYSATRTFTQAEVHTTSAFAASAFEPAGAVRGRVLLGGAPVAGADVFIAGIDGDVTDAAGRFRLVAVNGGTQTVSLDTTEPGPWRIIVDGEIVGEGTSTSVELPLGEVRR